MRDARIGVAGLPAAPGGRLARAQASGSGGDLVEETMPAVANAALALLLFWPPMGDAVFDLIA